MMEDLEEWDEEECAIAPIGARTCSSSSYSSCVSSIGSPHCASNSCSTSPVGSRSSVVLKAPGVHAKLAMRPLLARLVAVSRAWKLLGKAVGGYNPLRNLTSFLEYERINHVDPRTSWELLRHLGILAVAQDASCGSFARFFPPDLIGLGLGPEHDVGEHRVLVAHELFVWECRQIRGKGALRPTPAGKFTKSAALSVFDPGSIIGSSRNDNHAHNNINLLAGCALAEHPDVLALRRVLHRCRRICENGLQLADIVGVLRLQLGSVPCVASMAGICQFSAALPGVRIELDIAGFADCTCCGAVFTKFQ